MDLIIQKADSGCLKNTRIVTAVQSKQKNKASREQVECRKYELNAQRVK